MNTPTPPDAGWKYVPVDSGPNFSDSTLPEEMIRAGMEVLDRADDDLAGRNGDDVPDWDTGMEAVAVYRAMLSASPTLEQSSIVDLGGMRERVADLIWQHPAIELAITNEAAEGLADQIIALFCAGNAKKSDAPVREGGEDALNALAGMLDSFGGYSTPEVDAAITVMQAAGRDRWSMQAQMDDASWQPPSLEECPPEAPPPPLGEGSIDVGRAVTDAKSGEGTTLDGRLTEADALAQPQEVLSTLRAKARDRREVITIWRDGTWKRWDNQDDLCARVDYADTWLCCIPASELAQQTTARLNPQPLLRSDSDGAAGLNPPVLQEGESGARGEGNGCEPGHPIDAHPELKAWVERLANTRMDLSLGDWCKFVDVLSGALLAKGEKSR